MAEIDQSLLAEIATTPFAENASPATLTLELTLPPAEAARLPRLRALAPLKTGRVRTAAVRIIWHDTAALDLAADGLALAEQRGQWRLEYLRPTEGAPFWPPGAPPPALAEAASRDAIDHTLPDGLMPCAAFDGRAISKILRVGGAEVELLLLTGTVRAVALTQDTARLLLTGPGPAVFALAHLLAAEVTAAIPRASLAAEALAVARDMPLAPRHLGAPVLPADVPVAEAFARIAGHLTDVMLYWAPAAAAGTDGPEPVHQMRVAMRRLRSAATVFRRVAACPELDAARAGLKSLSARLGPARDWDVFCAGTGAAVGRAFPEERAVTKLLANAERQRQDSYAALRAELASADFRRLGLTLAELAATDAWHDASDPGRAAALRGSVAAFAGRVLTKRLKAMLGDAEDLAELPVEALHALRLHGKRMRYAAEFFAPLFPGREPRRFIRRLTALQERLGHLNDGAVAAALLADLPGAGPERAFAAGAVRGFVAAHSEASRARIVRSWKKFRKLKPFWL